MGSETIRNRQYGADYQTSRKEMTRVLKPFDLQALSIFLCIKVALVTDPAYAGCIFIHADSSIAPADGNPIPDRSAVYSCDYGRTCICPAHPSTAYACGWSDP